MIRLGTHCRSISRRSPRGRRVVEAAQSRRRRLAQRADVAAVVLVGDLARAVVELQLLQRSERLVALFDERKLTLIGLAGCVEAIVDGRRVAEERQRDEQYRAGCEHDAEDECDGGHARAGARRVTSRRCSRASGHNATAEPSRNTIPAIQSRLTSGFTSTFTYTTFVAGLTSSAITYRSSARSQSVRMPTSRDGSGGVRYWLSPDEIVPFQR